AARRRSRVPLHGQRRRLVLPQQGHALGPGLARPGRCGARSGALGRRRQDLPVPASGLPLRARAIVIGMIPREPIPPPRRVILYPREDGPAAYASVATAAKWLIEHGVEVLLDVHTLARSGWEGLGL